MIELRNKPTVEKKERGVSGRDFSRVPAFVAEYPDFLTRTFSSTPSGNVCSSARLDYLNFLKRSVP